MQCVQVLRRHGAYCWNNFVYESVKMIGRYNEDAGDGDADYAFLKVE